jgi:hypothetical protein
LFVGEDGTGQLLAIGNVLTVELLRFQLLHSVLIYVAAGSIPWAFPCRETPLLISKVIS